jgi:hypothetical protein
MGLAGAWAEASEALQTQINAAVMVNTLVIVRPLNAVPTGRTNTTGQPHRLLYAPRNRGSVRLKARRRDWWLSCI